MKTVLRNSCTADSCRRGGMGDFLARWCRVRAACALLTVSAVAALGQQAERSLAFTQLQTANEIAEAATVIRSITEIRELSTDASQKALSVRGERAQVEISEWLLPRLDRTRITPKLETSDLDYHPGGGSGLVVRVLYFKNAATGQERNEMVTVIRSLLEIRGAFVSQAAGALVLRSSPGQADAARWVFESLDGQGTAGGSGGDRMPGGGDDSIRLFSVKNAGTLEGFYRLATNVRTTLQARHLFTYTPSRTIAVRGTEALIGRAAEMLAYRRRPPGFAGEATAV